MEKTLKPRSLIIDTDVSYDDVIAILYLLQSPQVSVKAILVADNGVAHGKHGHTNIHRLLKLINHHEIPVACGSEKGLGYAHYFPNAFRERAGLLLGMDLPSTEKKHTQTTACELFITTARECNSKITLLALGPLTSIAEALQVAPEIKNKIDQIYMMGGAISVPGNVDELLKNGNTRAEWNIYFDPLAAKIVFESGIPITLISLDVTDQHPITKQFHDTLGSGDQTASTRSIHGLIAENPRMLSGAFCFWDPLTAVITTSPEIVLESKIINLEVLLEPENISGALEQTANGSPINVITKVDYKKFEEILLDGLRNKKHP